MILPCCCALSKAPSAESLSSFSANSVSAPLRVISFTLSRMPARPKLGLIAGNGKFPLLVLDAAYAQGYEVIVAAIKEETSPEIDRHNATAVHWMSLGELSRLIETF